MAQGTITRGTTPTLEFKINSTLDLNDVAEIYVTFSTKAGVKQRECTYSKDDVDIDFEHSKVILVLTQEDTLALSEPSALVQIRLRMNDGMAYASGIIETTIGKILKDGVI